MLVFCPATQAAATRLRMVGRDDAVWSGYAAVRGLREAAGLGPGEDEQADFVALSFAGVAALVTTADRRRLVLAVDVAAAQTTTGEPDDLGEVAVADLRWAQVTAVFADDEADADAVARARARLEPTSTVRAALETAAVRGLLDSTDLCWYDPAELDELS